MRPGKSALPCEGLRGRDATLRLSDTALLVEAAARDVDCVVHRGAVPADDLGVVRHISDRRHAVERCRSEIPPLLDIESARRA